MKIQKPRGFKDWCDLYSINNLEDPSGSRNKNYLRKRVISLIERAFISYGYFFVETPIVEELGVFAANDEAFLGDNRELFLLEKKSDDGRKYVLRPENTAAVVRFISEKKMLENNPMVIPVYYCGSCFRYERPQSGRFRQFTQMGIERINAGSVMDDVENILVMDYVFQSFGVKDSLTLKINFFSSRKVLEDWNNALTKYFEQYEEQLSENSRKRIYKNPHRILDDKEDSSKDFVKRAPAIDDFFSEEDKEKKQEFENIFEKLDIKVDWCPTLARGIDYYTGLIYEWQNERGLSIAAGGRYDDLFLRFGDKKYPSSGLAIGIERFMMFLEEVKYQAEIPVTEYFYFFNKSGEDWKDIHSFLRCDDGRDFYKVFIEYGDFDLSEHLKRAERMGCSWVLHLGFNSELQVNYLPGKSSHVIDKKCWYHDSSGSWFWLQVEKITENIRKIK